MNDVEVLNRFAQLEEDAEEKGLTLTFSGEEFLLRKLDSQLWAKCDHLREVAGAIAAYARMCDFGVAPLLPLRQYPRAESPMSMRLSKTAKN